MEKCMTGLVNKLMATGNLDTPELTELLQFRNIETTQYLYEQACLVRQREKKDEIQIWGRIPISSYCKYDCKMCGIRRDNQFVNRFRLSNEEILKYCRDFEKLGVRNIVLESGDDIYLTEQRVSEIILSIKKHHSNCNLILALGEKTEDAYRHWSHIGVSRYILRHGSASEQHFKKVFPSNMSLLIRKQQLWQLRECGYHVGTGFLVGIPYQMIENVVEDIAFIKSFAPPIIDMGAFIPVLRTPFERERSGNGDMTLYIMAILRLMLPNASIIASPTLDCVLREGKVKSLDAGADVIISDVSDDFLLQHYSVYERKNGRLALSVDHIDELNAEIKEKGFRVV